MKIVLFHPVLLPPRDYGGVERVVLWLASGLRDLGHQVFVAAREGSRLPRGVELISVPAGELSAGDLVAKLPPGVDLVHFQAPPEKEFSQRCAIPSITTIHGNGKIDEVFPENSVFLSRDHAHRHGRKTFVYNGVDPEEFHLNKNVQGERSPLFLSKTTLKVKNLAAAMEIARSAGRSLSIAGGNRPIGLRLKALLQGHRWVGPVVGEKKAELLSNSSALLFPVIWSEPFGLVMVEAMLSGVPVVGSATGSVPEVIGESGGIAVQAPFWMAATREERENGLVQWVDALRRAEKADRRALREDAIRRFSHRRMAEDYLQVYNTVIRGERL